MGVSEIEPSASSRLSLKEEDDGLSWPTSLLQAALARIFHADRDEGAAKADEARQTRIWAPGCMRTYCLSSNRSLTKQSSAFPASAVDRYEISGLGMLLLLALGAFAFRLQASTNLWDYLIDPIYGAIAFGMMVKEAMLLRKH